MAINNVNIAFYRPEDWARLLVVIDDKGVFHDTWEEWHKEYLKTSNYLKSEGFQVNEVVVDIDELIRYCAFRGIKNDGKARSQFVSQWRG